MVKTTSKKALALAMALVMMFSFSSLALAASYDDAGSAYPGFQGTGGNTLIVFTDDAQTVKYLETDSANGVIYNKIETRFKAAEVVTFDFTMSAGMNSFNSESFKTANMPRIAVYDSTCTQTVATYDAETLDFVSFTQAAEGGKYNGTSYITVSIDAATLKDDTVYALKFGRDICGNNASKTLGSDIVFLFKTEKVESENTSFLSRVLAAISSFFTTVKSFVKQIIDFILSYIK